MMTPNGKPYDIVKKEQIGAGVTGVVNWEIQSHEKLDYAEVEAIIESQYPHAGYGSSGWRRLPQSKGEHFFRILVSSNASCD